MLLFYFQNLGNPELWADNGGILGLVLLGLMLVLFALVALMIRTFNHFTKSNSELIRNMGTISTSMNSMNLGIATKLVKSNERALEMKKDITSCLETMMEIKDNNMNFVNETHKKIEEMLTKVESKLEIVSQHLENNHATMIAMNESIKSTNQLISK